MPVTKGIYIYLYALDLYITYSYIKCNVRDICLSVLFD